MDDGEKRAKLGPLRIFENFRWYKSSIGPSPVQHRDADKAAEIAEEEVAKAISELFPDRCSTHLRTRVPNPDSFRRKGEIDVIALCPNAILVIEVKNFSGRVEIEDGSLVQRRRRGRGKLDHGDVFGKNSEKASDLARIFRSKTDREAPEILPLLVFANRSVIRGVGLESRSDTFLIDELEGVKEMLAGLEEINEEDSEALKEMISEFGTWDEAIFKDGGSSKCDLLETSLPAGVSRKKSSEFRVVSERGPLGTILLGPRLSLSIIGRDGRTSESVLEPRSRITLLLHGERVDSPLSVVSRASFGHEGIPRWRKAKASRRKGGKYKRRTGKSGKGGVRRWKDFKVGMEVEGTALKWIPDGLLVELDASGIKGLVHISNFETEMALLMAKQLIREGSGARVRIKSNRGPGKIRLDHLD